MENKDFIKKVSEIQKTLKVPKNREVKNKFGAVMYKYRNCEDIFEAVRDLLNGMILTVSDEIIEIGGSIYVKATATLESSGNEKVENTAYAKEPRSMGNMNESQITGSTSSYARKYALNGLFLIDDTTDADMQAEENNGEKPPEKEPVYGDLTLTDDIKVTMLKYISSGKKKEVLASLSKYKNSANYKEIYNLVK